MFILSTGISVVQGTQALSKGNYAGASKSGLDIGMGYVGVAGGPVGAVASGVYFGIDTFIGWDNAFKRPVPTLPLPPIRVCSFLIN